MEDIPDAGLTDCKCPRCGKEHKLFMLWTSPFKARMFCHPCRTFAQRLSVGIASTAIYVYHKDIDLFLSENEV